MTTTTLTVKNGAIRLPKKLQKSWGGADVYISGDQNTITLQRLAKPALSFRQMLDEFRKAAKQSKLSRRDVLREVEKAKKEKRRLRS